MQRQPLQQPHALRGQQGGRRDVHRHVAVDGAQVLGGTLQREQLEGVAETHAVRLGEDDVGGHAPVRREPAERLGADAVAGGQLDDRLQHDDRPAGRHQRHQAVLDLVPPRGFAHARLDDEGSSPGEHVHERLVALGQRLVGGQPGGAEGAVDRPSLRTTGTET